MNSHTITLWQYEDNRLWTEPLYKTHYDKKGLHLEICSKTSKRYWRKHDLQFTPDELADVIEDATDQMMNLFAPLIVKYSPSNDPKFLVACHVATRLSFASHTALYKKFNPTKNIPKENSKNDDISGYFRLTDGMVLGLRSDNDSDAIKRLIGHEYAHLFESEYNENLKSTNVMTESFPCLLEHCLDYPLSDTNVTYRKASRLIRSLAKKRTVDQSTFMDYWLFLKRFSDDTKTMHAIKMLKTVQ